MVDISDRDLEELRERILPLVENAFSASKDNIDRFHDMREFLYIDTLSESVIAACNKFGWPPMQLNTLEAGVSRLGGEFAKQMPSPSVKAATASTPAEIVDFVEGSLRYKFESADMDNIKKSLYGECMSGGFSAAEVVTDYISPYSIDQDISIEKCFDPTLVFFDPLARKNHAGDGEFLFKFTPMLRATFEEKYPDFDFNDVKFSAIMPNMVGLEIPWFLKDDKYGTAATNSANEVIYVCDFYKKKLVEKKLVRIIMPDGMPHDMLEDEYLKASKKFREENKAPFPPVKQERKTFITEIWLHPFVKNQYLKKPTKISGQYLPIVRFSGNYQIIKGGIVQRPYHYQAVDSQKLKNMAAIAIANGVETMSNTQFLMAEESMPTAEQDKIAFRSPQKQNAAIIYKAWPQTNMTTPNPAPIIIPKSSFDPTLLQLIQQLSQIQQEILGNFDTQLGINQGKMSGLAFQEALSQSNASAMPFIDNYMDAMNQIALIYVDLLPDYHRTPRSVPIIDSDGTHKSIIINNPTDPKSPMLINHDSLNLLVSVKTDVNFELQKQRALEMMIELMKVVPAFAKFFGEGKGLVKLMDNISIRGKESVMKEMMEFIENEQKNAKVNEEKMMMTNPEVVKQKIAQQEMQLKQMQMAQDAKFEQMQIMVDREKLQMEMMIEKMKMQESQLETLAKIRESEAKTQIATITAQAEMRRADVDQAIAIDEHLTNKIENDREHLSDMLDHSVKHMHNTNQHTQAMIGLALDAEKSKDSAAQAAV